MKNDTIEFDQTICAPRCRLKKNCTVTIHQQLDGNMSIRYGPHIVGRYTATGQIRPAATIQKTESRGKGGPVKTVKNHTPVSHRPHRPLEIPQPGGIPTFSPLRLRFPCYQLRSENPVGKPQGGVGSNHRSTDQAGDLTT